MKTIKIILIVIILVSFGKITFAQMHDHSKMNSPMNSANSAKTETLPVAGNCDMCKARIEKAARLEGVSKADWDQKSKVLTVAYDPAKTNLDQIAGKIAAAGHDNAKLKATDKAYNALPSCCKYERTQQHQH